MKNYNVENGLTVHSPYDGENVTFFCKSQLSKMQAEKMTPAARATLKSLPRDWVEYTELRNAQSPEWRKLLGLPEPK